MGIKSKSNTLIFRGNKRLTLLSTKWRLRQRDGLHNRGSCAIRQDVDYVHLSHSWRSSMLKATEKLQVSIVSIQCNRCPYSRNPSFHLIFCNARKRDLTRKTRCVMEIIIQEIERSSSIASLVAPSVQNQNVMSLFKSLYKAWTAQCQIKFLETSWPGSHSRLNHRTCFHIEVMHVAPRPYNKNKPLYLSLVPALEISGSFSVDFVVVTSATAL